MAAMMSASIAARPAFFARGSSQLSARVGVSTSRGPRCVTVAMAKVRAFRVSRQHLACLSRNFKLLHTYCHHNLETRTLRVR